MRRRKVGGWVDNIQEEEETRWTANTVGKARGKSVTRGVQGERKCETGGGNVDLE